MVGSRLICPVAVAGVRHEIVSPFRSIIVRASIWSDFVRVVKGPMPVIRSIVLGDCFGRSGKYGGEYNGGHHSY